jgi:hypothetical protein
VTAGLYLFSGDISLPFSEVTGVLFKMKNKGPRSLGFKGSSGGFLFFVFHLNPRPLESLNPNTCRLEKNARDRGSVPGEGKIEIGNRLV